MKTFLIWVSAIVITLVAAIYQRATGPTYPLRFNTEVLSQQVKLKLTRSATVDQGCKVKIPAVDGVKQTKIVFRKYPGTFSWDTLSMNYSNTQLVVNLPIQPPAGKLEYYAIMLDDHGREVFSNVDNTAIVRFKGSVPALVLIPHVVLMFLAMMCSTVVALMAVFRIGNFRFFTFITFGLLFVGGLILGPIVQHYAFGEAWTGWPYGGDLTDNKTLIAVLFWLLAVVLNIKSPKRWGVILASVVLMSIYSVPHSAWGSELNHQSGQINTGSQK